MRVRERHIERGSGPAVVFSHGTLMDATMFDPQLDYLAERGHRAIAYNSRVLTGEPAPHTLSDLVEDCRVLLDDSRYREVRARGHVGRRLHGA